MAVNDTTTKSAQNELLSDKEQKVYYVYKTFVDGVLKYIGMGKGLRIKHCDSGKSSCSELNRDFHAGKRVTVEKFKENLTKNEAQWEEHYLIEEFLGTGIYNKTSSPNLSTTPSISKVEGIIVDMDQSRDELYKLLVKASPDIKRNEYDKMMHWMRSCGLTLYTASVGKGRAKTIVLDSPRRYNDTHKHLGCSNYPNCYLVGCGV